MRETFYFIYLAEAENFKVLIVSSKFSLKFLKRLIYQFEATVEITKVFIFPPKESCNNLVNFDSLKGIGNLLPFAKKWMHLAYSYLKIKLPKVDSD